MAGASQEAPAICSRVRTKLMEMNRFRCLSRLTAPLPARLFLESVWECEPLVQAEGDPEGFADLLTMADIDFAVTSADMRYPQFRVVRDGSPLPLQQYTRTVRGGRAADPERILRAYADGATIILQGFHRRWPPLTRFCSELEQELSHRVQTNIYLTPPGAQGFAAHYDTHDVFVIQLHGSKQWRLYDAPFPLPARDQTHRKRGVHPGEVRQSFELRPGGVIYIPRGWFHDALTSESSSLHITLGITGTTWLDLMRDLVKHCAEEPAFRRNLPPGYAHDPAAGRLAEQEWKQLLQRLPALTEPAAMLEERAGKFRSRSRGSSRGRLLDLEMERSLAPDSRVLRREVAAILEPQGERMILKSPGVELTFPAFAAECLRFCLDHPAYTAADLPESLDLPGRLVLLRRLLREGFCTLRPDDG